MTKLAEQIAGPNIVLPWLLNVLQAPAVLSGFTMPVKQVASLLPQIVVAGRIRTFARRKWFWVAAGAIQSVMLLLMIPAALYLPPLSAGLAIVLLLGLFSLASGVGSVAFQDVLGKTIPRGKRGNLLGNRSSIGGALTIASGIIIERWINGSADITIYLVLLLAAAVLWAAASLTFAQIDEVPGATGGGRNALQEAKSGRALAKKKSWFRGYLATRAILVFVEISAPYFVLHAQKTVSGAIDALGVMVVATGLAKLGGSPFWGRFSDGSSRLVMGLAALMAVASALAALAFGTLPQSWQSPYLYGVIFLLLGFAEAGVRVGRKTYLVDATIEKTRATHVAFSNTLIGGFTLLAGTIGFLADLFSIRVLLFALIVVYLAGALLAWRLPEARDVQKK